MRESESGKNGYCRVLTGGQEIGPAEDRGKDKLATLRPKPSEKSD